MEYNTDKIFVLGLYHYLLPSLTVLYSFVLLSLIGKHIRRDMKIVLYESRSLSLLPFVSAKDTDSEQHGS
jgi:hypothetical protein